MAINWLLRNVLTQPLTMTSLPNSSDCNSSLIRVCSICSTIINLLYTSNFRLTKIAYYFLNQPFIGKNGANNFRAGTRGGRWGMKRKQKSHGSNHGYGSMSKRTILLKLL